MPGSGKEEVVKLAVKRGVHVVRMGDIVREEVTRRMLAFSDQSMGGLADEERRKYGQGIWAERTLPRLEEPVTLIDGVRGSAELSVYESSLGRENLICIGIHASPEVRFERVVRRGRGDTTESRGDFDSRDRRELSWGLGEALALCNYMLVNEGTLEELHTAAGRVLDLILGK
jgi:dephospho-CoA kinase